MSFEVLRDYFKEIRKIPVLNSVEEISLAKRAQKGDEKARIKLIRSNLRLVVKIARRYERLGLSLPDLIEEGNIGLMKALSRFNHRLGFRFSTYASWWIRQHVIRAIANQSRVVRIPVYMSELLHKMRKAQERLVHKYGRKPTNGELAKALKVTVRKIHELQRVSYRASSLDRRVSEDADMEFIDLLQDDEIEAVDELVNLFEREEVEVILSVMDERERKIVELRFGIKTGLPKTLAEVARVFGITRERVRQIEKEALERMRDLINSGEPILRIAKEEKEKEEKKLESQKPVKKKSSVKTKGKKPKAKPTKAKVKSKKIVKKAIKSKKIKVNKLKIKSKKVVKKAAKSKKIKVNKPKIKSKKAVKKVAKNKKVVKKTAQKAKKKTVSRARKTKVRKGRK
ncbi:MAG: RNA polymerase sigma factor RpoD/SigA [Candidatus Saelkia tenebricola]|nr:RNA polymerase sigma factor RpoD/SigA [Candidatus Saelkia tenebricola]